MAAAGPPGDHVTPSPPLCLIGPTYPFRGGVAHHTTLLYRHLSARRPVTFYAFRRPYPAWLFPGRSDRDTSAAPLREPGAAPALDWLNPATWLATGRRIARARPALVIVPWWTSFWTAPFWTVATLVRRVPGSRILAICHNVVDHEARPFSRACARAVLGRAHRCLVHSEADERRLRALLPAARVVRGFHPLYDFARPGLLQRDDARARLGLEGDTILFFGFVRPYKGLHHLLEAMPLVRARRKVTLLVVGEFWEGRREAARTIARLGLEDAVRCVDRYVPNEEVGLYFSAADLVVLPYVAGTASGVVQLAYGLDTPVVATRVGALAEVVEDGVTGYLVPPGQPAALADAVVRALDEGRAAEFADNIRRRKQRFSWERLADLVEAIADGAEGAGC